MVIDGKDYIRRIGEHNIKIPKGLPTSELCAWMNGYAMALKSVMDIYEEICWEIAEEGTCEHNESENLH